MGELGAAFGNALDLRIANETAEPTFYPVELTLVPLSFGEYLTRRMQFEAAIEQCEDDGARDDLRESLAAFQAEHPEHYAKEFDRF